MKDEREGGGERSGEGGDGGTGREREITKLIFYYCMVKSDNCALRVDIT